MKSDFDSVLKQKSIAEKDAMQKVIRDREVLARNYRHGMLALTSYMVSNKKGLLEYLGSSWKYEKNSYLVAHTWNVAVPETHWEYDPDNKFQRLYGAIRVIKGVGSKLEIMISSKVVDAKVDVFEFVQDNHRMWEYPAELTLVENSKIALCDSEMFMVKEDKNWVFEKFFGESYLKCFWGVLKYRSSTDELVEHGCPSFTAQDLRVALMKTSPHLVVDEILS